MAAMLTLNDFIKESNRIEGITRRVTKAEYREAERFLALEYVEVGDLVTFVKVYQPNAKLRTELGADVSIIGHSPPLGGPHVFTKLRRLLRKANINLLVEVVIVLGKEAKVRGADPHTIHVDYELLHPFTDGNGRSGRMLWLWMVNRFPGRLPRLSFLQSFYYSTLDNARE